MNKIKYKNRNQRSFYFNEYNQNLNSEKKMKEFILAKIEYIYFSLYFFV